MRIRIAPVLPVLSLAFAAVWVACPTGPSETDAGPTDSGTQQNQDSGTVADSGPTNTDSGTSADAGPCSSTLGTCNPCPGYTGNSLGVGAYCSAGGHQCAAKLKCPRDFGQSQNFCVFVGCGLDAGCGAGACCVTEQNPFGGTVTVCLPTGCGQCPDAG